MNFSLHQFSPSGFVFVSFFVLVSVAGTGCGQHQGIQEKEVVETAAQINETAEDLIKNTLADVLQNEGALPDSVTLKNPVVLRELYQQNKYTLLWSSEGVFHKKADSLLSFLDSGRLYGLFPADYETEKLKRLRTVLAKDTAKENRLDAAKWAYADMLSTSAFVQLVKDLKFGRLVADSVLAKDTLFGAAFFARQMQAFQDSSLVQFAAALEPANKEYKALKQALRHFLSEADFRAYTVVKAKDSLLMRKTLYKRIGEEDSLTLSPVKSPDSAALATAIKKYQRFKKLKEDGKLSSALIRRLNNTDREKFIRIAITLDKYKQLPPLPEEYIWVNLPSYFMEVRKGDSVALLSKIICGKPVTKTPQLTSAVSSMITYPQWTIPESIIKKEILPGLKRNAGYTQRRGYSVVDLKGNAISPYGVNWAKYKNSIPYKVVQGSGDANALGIIKFNFANPYAVYLHDTNQRYLFAKKERALSHGCVRVQNWKDLAVYLLRRDSLADTSRYTPVDSLSSWLAQKRKKVLKVYQPLPLFIRYFSTEGQDGKLVFHDDIYEEDKRLRDKFFASR